MPIKKQFDVMSLEIPFHMMKIDMFELSEYFNKNIKNILIYLTEGRTVIVECPQITDTHFLIYKNEKDQFIIKEYNDLAQVFEPSDFINWLYEKAPYFTMVDYKNF